MQTKLLRPSEDPTAIEQAGALLREYCEQEQGGMTDEA